MVDGRMKIIDIDRNLTRANRYRFLTNFWKRKRGEWRGLDTPVIHAINHEVIKTKCITFTWGVRPQG